VLLFAHCVMLKRAAMMWTVSLPRYNSTNQNQSHGFLSNSVRAHSKRNESFSWKSGAQESSTKKKPFNVHFQMSLKSGKLDPNTLINSQHATSWPSKWTKAFFICIFYPTSASEDKTPIKLKAVNWLSVLK